MTRKALISSLCLYMAFMVSEVYAASSKACDDIWRQVSVDTKLPSPLEKAKTMELRGNECMNDAEFIVRLANFYIQGKELNRADKIVSTQIKSQPYSLALKERLAFINFQKGDLSTAQEQADAIVAKDPNYTAAYLTLAAIALKKRDWQSSLEYGRRAYDLGGDPLVLLAIVGPLHQLGHHEDAANIAYRALKENPALISRSVGINEAIYSLGALGRFDEATQLAKRRMAADPEWRQDPVFVQAVQKLKIGE